jgi:hypothetical protein
MIGPTIALKAAQWKRTFRKIPFSRTREKGIKDKGNAKSGIACLLFKVQLNRG